jgi:chemotaxis protein MotB
MEERTKDIIRKVKKKSHGDAHGGSWKVAYADSCTAMMAFFLLMWLLAMVAPEKRAAWASIFRARASSRRRSPIGASFLDQSSGVNRHGQKGRRGPPQRRGQERPGDAGRAMRQAIDDQLYTMRNQVFVDMTRRGPDPDRGQ